MNWAEKITAEHRERQQQDLWRTRLTLASEQATEVSVDGRQLLNFSSNDYLGLAGEHSIREAASQAIERWGVGSGASHLVCGHQQPHADLEQQLAQFVGAESAVLFSTGYMANLAVPPTFLGRGDVLIQDRLNHASLIDAAALCRATLKRYPHRDTEQAAAILRHRDDARAMIATDGVFSMDGTIAPADALVPLANEHDALLLVDDAHGFGVLGRHGRGTLDHFSQRPSGNTLMLGTLSKSVGAFGAFVAGDRLLIEHLIQHARPFIYTTALPPAIAGAASTAIELMQSQVWRREKLHENVALFRRIADQRGLTLMPSETPIQSIVFQRPASAIAASTMLRESGILVIAIRPPTVPAGTSRLRITLSALHSPAEIERLVEVLASEPVAALMESNSP